MERGKMGNVTARITTDKQVPGFWRVTLNHPPINTIDDQMYDEIFDLVEAIVAEPSLKVVTFESANADFFLAHYGVGESASRFGKPRWIEAATRLAHSNVLSIAVIRGRARGAATSSLWPATCASPVERKPSLVSQRSVSA
jgi:enoyl-CoA hydratase/carnithine racemase